jgi:hypothetical protein
MMLEVMQRKHKIEAGNYFSFLLFILILFKFILLLLIYFLEFIDALDKNYQ